MTSRSKLIEQLKSFGRSSFFIYPIVIIISIPLLLIINTVWNLRTFNRDVNHIVRSHAVSIAESLKPAISRSIGDDQVLNDFLSNTKSSTPDILEILIFQKDIDGFVTVASTANITESAELSQSDLNNLSSSFNQSFAGLVYDVELEKNVWNISVPLGKFEGKDHTVFMKLGVGTVEEVLQRTSRDSYIILGVLVLITLALLVNHFVFVKRAARAKQLEELDKMKDAFLSMAAHELRTPLTGLAGYLELLRDEIANIISENTKKYLTTLDGLTKDLANLVEDLLDVSRIEQGRLEINIKEMKLDDIIQNVITNLKPTIEKKGLSIEYKADEIPIIKSDPDRLRQVITNLIGNSIKYTLKGGITIEAVSVGKNIKVTVGDTGIGIPPEELPKLFTRFHRVKDEKTIEVRGTGLGLWITKNVIERLGGKISVQSIYGTGTKVEFSLPISS